MTRLSSSHGVELVRLTAAELNDSRAGYLVRLLGDTHEMYSSYSLRDAQRAFAAEVEARRKGLVWP